jgi:hypothetical protein
MHALSGRIGEAANADRPLAAVCEEIIKPVLPHEWLTKDTQHLVHLTHF